VPDESARFSKLEALSAVRDDRTLEAKERLVLVMLVAHTDAHGRCYPSLERLAESTGLARRSVVAALAALRTPGRALPVSIATNSRGKPPSGGGRPPNMYTLTVEFGARAASNSGASTGQQVPESPSPEDGEFRANGEGVSGKTCTEFRAPVALEAGHRSCTEKLANTARSQKRGARKGRKRNSSTTDPNVRKLWDHWHAEYARLRDCKPAFAASQQGRAGKSFKDILEATGDLEHAKAVVTQALSKGFHVEPWQILGALNQYRGGSQPNGRRAGTQRGVLDEAEAARWGKDTAEELLGGVQ
jgi:hypothetical protein